MLKLVSKSASEYWVADKTFAIGSATDNHLALAETAIEPHHARITYDGKRYCLRDLNSSNGTYVNNQRINQKSLASGDEIRIGSVTLDVVDPLASAAQTRWCLVASANWLHGASFTLPFSAERKRVVIGRAEHCDVILPETHLAREHIELSLHADHLELKNLKFNNTTYINDRPCSQGKLYSGDRLRLDVYNFKVIGPSQAPEPSNKPAAPQLTAVPLHKEQQEPEKRWKTRSTSPGNRVEEKPTRPAYMDNLALKLGAAVALMGLLLLGVYLLNT